MTELVEATVTPAVGCSYEQQHHYGVQHYLRLIDWPVLAKPRDVVLVIRALHILRIESGLHCLSAEPKASRTVLVIKVPIEFARTREREFSLRFYLKLITERESA